MAKDVQDHYSDRHNEAKLSHHRNGANHQGAEADGCCGRTDETGRQATLRLA